MRTSPSTSTERGIELGKAFDSICTKDSQIHHITFSYKRIFVVHLENNYFSIRKVLAYLSWHRHAYIRREHRHLHHQPDKLSGNCKATLLRPFCLQDKQWQRQRPSFSQNGQKQAIQIILHPLLKTNNPVDIYLKLTLYNKMKHHSQRMKNKILRHILGMKRNLDSGHHSSTQHPHNAADIPTLWVFIIKISMSFLQM